MAMRVVSMSTIQRMRKTGNDIVQQTMGKADRVQDQELGLALARTRSSVDMLAVGRLSLARWVDLFDEG